MFYWYVVSLEEDEIVARMLSVDDSSGCHVAEGLVMRCSVAVNSGLWTCYVFLVKGFCLCLSQATSSGLHREVGTSHKVMDASD